MQLTMIKVLPTSLWFSRCGVEGLALIAMLSQTDLLIEAVIVGTFFMVLPYDPALVCRMVRKGVGSRRRAMCGCSRRTHCRAKRTVAYVTHLLCLSPAVMHYITLKSLQDSPIVAWSFVSGCHRNSDTLQRISQQWLS